MDLTQGTEVEKGKRAKRNMLYFGIISLIMSFAGLTSAFIVSSKRPDWLAGFLVPKAFWVSTVLIVCSSLVFFLAKKSIAKEARKKTSGMLLLGFALGLAFVIFQFIGFHQIIDAGYHFTGPTSNVTMSFIFLIAFVHVLHVIAGLVVILVVIYNHYKKQYNANNYLGLELGITFWHFVDILWIYLILFFYFFR
ncbi:MAG: cytochrome c oxidase subunit 3 [Flavobacteriaceae bacterium]|nr:cytochrome c oxidase subunit 3 [Flavobacteriaceae bacterium]